jgi:hypothetical protein
MSDRPTFETQLRLALATYASDAPADVDPIAMATFASRARVRTSWNFRMGSLRPILVGLLVIATVGAGVALVASRLEHRAPPRTYIDEVVSAPDLSQEMTRPVVVDLTDGRVLVIGAGSEGDGRPTTALVYDPMTGSSASAGPFASPADPEEISAAVRLMDGRVFVTGNGAPQIFDPRTLQFTAVGPMVTERTDPALALLHDGRVLIASGWDSNGEWLAAAELFDPATGTFSTTGPMATAGTASPWGATATLPDGRVFMAGGVAEIYDPMTGAFSAAGRNDIFGASTAMVTQDGRVVVVGKSGIGTRTGHAAIWEPASGTFTEILTTAPGYPIDRGTLLDDGRILVTGADSGLRWAGVYDLETHETKKITPPKAWWPSVAKLTDGRVMFVGGVNDWKLRLCPEYGCVSSPAVKTVEIFE